MGGLIVASPKIIKTSNGIDVITVGSDNRLWVKSQDNNGVNSDWKMAADIKIKGEISAARAGDTIIVAIMDDADTLWIVEKDTKGNWRTQGTEGAALSDPVLYSNGNTVYFFHIGKDNALWHKIRVNGAWGEWKSLGGFFTDIIKAAGNGNDVIVSARDNEGGIKYRISRNEQWKDWQIVAGIAANDYDLAGQNNEFIFIVRRADTNDLYRISYSPYCAANSISGCSICNTDRFGWLDSDSLCGKNQICEKGKCAAMNQSFSLNTDDTKITLAVSSNKLFLKELINPAAGWNWTADASQVPLMQKAIVNGTIYSPINWIYDSATTDNSNGKKITLRFISSNPNLELRSEWWARPGKGPIRHVDYIVNKTGQQITIFNDSTFDVVLKGSNSGSQKITLWSFNDDGATPDAKHAYNLPVDIEKKVINDGYFNKRLPYTPYHGWAPYIILDKNGSGVYFGSEWSYGTIAVTGVAGTSNAVGARVVMADSTGNDFKTDVFSGETFMFPPGFVGTYNGDADDAGNSLKSYLFNYSMPEILRSDTSFPKVQWNSYGAIGTDPGSSITLESKYYPLVDAVAPLGFEEMMLDIGWWAEYPTPPGTPNPPYAHSTNWSRGIKAARDYAYNKGMRLGVYDNSSYDFTKTSGISGKKAIIQYLYDQYKIDVWRSDGTAGPFIGMSYGGESRARYQQDQEYWAIKGFYQMLDDLAARYGNKFQWENCNGGGQMKDFGAMKRATKISNTDTYLLTHNRMAFYDTSYYLHPIQIHGALGDLPSGTLIKEESLLFQFRSASMGSPQIFLDSPNGGNGGKIWSQTEKSQITKAVNTYKTKIRPLIRSGNLYHILPRPDGVNWDGMEYYDNVAGKGATYLFKPSASAPGTENIKLKGLNPSAQYAISFEDGTNPAAIKTGADLANQGINISLSGAYASEIMFFDIVSSTCSTSQCATSNQNNDKSADIKSTTEKIEPETKPAAKMTRAEIIQKINEIIATINKLKEKLAAITGKSLYTCDKITKNLFYGAKNDIDQTKCLQKILQSQNYNVSISGDYDLATKTAVKQFQEKYSQEILAPYKLKS